MQHRKLRLKNYTTLFVHNFLHKGEAALRRNLQEHDQKSAILSERRKS